MTFFQKCKLPGAIALCLLALCQCAHRKPYPVYFLTESSGQEQGAAFVVVYQQTPYNRMPIFSLESFDKFRSFLTADGSYGVSLYLKKEYRMRLYTTSIDANGKKLLPVVNGLAFEPLKIDRPIVDGTLVIWNGLNGYDLKEISRTVEPADPDMEKKRYQDKNPRPLPEKPKNLREMKDANGRAMPQLMPYSAS